MLSAMLLCGLMLEFHLDEIEVKKEKEVKKEHARVSLDPEGAPSGKGRRQQRGLDRSERGTSVSLGSAIQLGRVVHRGPVAL